MILYRPNQWQNGGIGLCVDVEAGERPHEENVREPRNRSDAVNEQRVDFSRRQVGDIGVEARAGSEIGIMECEQDAIGAEVYVGLQVSKAQIDGVLESRQRVLWPFA